MFCLKILVCIKYFHNFKSFWLVRFFFLYMLNNPEAKQCNFFYTFIFYRKCSIIGNKKFYIIYRILDTNIFAKLFFKKFINFFNVTYFFNLSTYVEKVLFLGQIFEVKILIELYVLKSPESEKYIFSVWSLRVCVLSA